MKKTRKQSGTEPFSRPSNRQPATATTETVQATTLGGPHRGSPRNNTRLTKPASHSSSTSTLNRSPTINQQQPQSSSSSNPTQNSQQASSSTSPPPPQQQPDTQPRSKHTKALATASLPQTRDGDEHTAAGQQQKTLEMPDAWKGISTFGSSALAGTPPLTMPPATSISATCAAGGHGRVWCYPNPTAANPHTTQPAGVPTNGGCHSPLSTGDTTNCCSSDAFVLTMPRPPGATVLS